MHSPDFEYPVLQRWTGRTKKILILASLISGITTFQGIATYAMDGETGLFKSVIGPLLLTIVSVAVSIFTYSYAYERYPLAKTWEERNRVHIIIFFVSILLICVSSYFTIINLGGPRSLLRKLQSDLIEAEEAFDEIVLLRRMEKELLVPLSLAAGKTATFAKGEEKGTLSRKDGNGKVVANVTGLSANFTKLEEALESSLADHEIEADEGHIILEDIRGILNDEKMSAREKAAMVVPLFNSLNGVFAALKISAVPAIVAAVQNIDDTSLARGSYMDTALEAIKTPIQKTKQEILKQVALIKQHKEPIIPRFHMVDEEEAIWQHAEAALFSIVFALSLDVGIPILGLFCLFFIGRREIRQQQRGWNSYGTNHQVGITGAGAQPNANAGSLWRTNGTASRRGDQSGQNRRNRPEPPVA